jgi:ComF family protein
MILGLLFQFSPFTCPGCGEASSRVICKICLSSMRKNNQLIAPQSQGILGIFPIFISYSTTHPILTFWKDHGGEELKRILFSPSSELIQNLKEKQFDLIIPIPQHEERSLKRGHASAFEVAKLFSTVLSVPIQTDFLRLKKSQTNQMKQANLNSWERKHSENPFESAAFEAKKILIVDDFITSGSTLDKAAHCLEENNPGLQIHAASLGWKPKRILRN